MESSRINPKENANIFSVIFFYYTLKLFRTGRKKELEQEDLYQVVTSCKSEKLGARLQHLCEKNPKKLKITWIYSTIWNLYGFYYLFLGILKITVNITLLFIQPYATGKLVSYFVPGQISITKKDAYFYGFLLIGIKFLKAVYVSNNDLLVLILGIKIRATMCSIIYRKVLKLSTQSLDNFSVGKIITLLSRDAEAFIFFMRYANEIWIGVTKMIIVGFIVYKKTGVAAFAGIGVYVVYLLLQVYAAVKTVGFRKDMSRKSDIRMQVVQEVISGIRLLKMYTWENMFKTKISTARKEELKSEFRMFFWRNGILILGDTTLYLGLFVFFLTYYYLGNYITGEVVFFVLTSFRILSESLNTHTSAGILMLAETLACSERIVDLLNQTNDYMNKPKRCKSKEPMVCLKNVTLLLKNRKVIHDVDMFVDGGLTIVTGAMASGKTCLLKTMLQEYAANTGNVIIHGDISYASQKPWLFPLSIRQNIVLWEKFNEDRYFKVLKLCNLLVDLKMLPKGDATIVEDCGANLSKGQQARINLARALYKESDIYLLDDCLPDLDEYIGDTIFKECITTFLKNKLIIYFSNNTKYLKYADKIYVIENGKLRQKTKDSTTNISVLQVENNPISSIIQEEKENLFCNETTKLIEKDNTQPSSTVYREMKKIGNVDFEVFQKYIKYGGGYFMLILTITAFLVSAVSSSYTYKLISKVVNLEESIKQNNNTILPQDLFKQRQNLYILVPVMATFVIFTSWLKLYSVYWTARRVSINLHKKLTSSIVSATMKFFDQHLFGNILNRFCKDFVVVDESMPYNFYSLFTAIAATIGIIALIINVNAIFIIPLLVFFIILAVVRQFYITTSRSLKRLDISTTSPVLGHMTSTLDGLTTIRAFDAETRFTTEFDYHLDINTSASYTYQCIVKAFAFLCDLLGVIFIAAVILKFLFFDDGTATAGSVGLAITQATMLTTILEMGIRQWAEMENDMTSVERILEYVKAKQENEQGVVVDKWPWFGKITYDNVSLSYTTSKNSVLNQVNFTIKPGEKTAIVGRTGVGKSSIISCLFRMYDYEGKITIDDIDIKTLSLEFLRSSISVIPQNSMLFSVSVRENIDPKGEHTDEEIWNVIEVVNMKGYISNLDMEITDKLFSTGQKQLLCIARTIIHKSKIVIFDEAAANLDSENSNHIYNAMQNHFATSSILIITHNLKTVQNCDKVILLDKGHIIEFDDRKKLLKNEDSTLYKMINQCI